MATRSRLFDDIHDPRLADLVRAADRPSAAAVAPLVSAPRAEGFASSHAADRTISTHVPAVRSADVPASLPIRTIGRFSY